MLKIKWTGTVCSESRCAHWVGHVEKSTVYCDCPQKLNELQTAITTCIKKHITSRSAERVWE
jgi:hypothetical protein